MSDPFLGVHAQNRRSFWQHCSRWPKCVFTNHKFFFISRKDEIEMSDSSYYPFLGTVATSGVFSFFFKHAQASKHSGTKTSSGVPPPGRSIGKHSRKNGFRHMRATISSRWVQAAIQSDYWSRRYWIFTYWSARGGKPLLVFVPLCLLACALFEKKRRKPPRWPQFREKGNTYLFCPTALLTCLCFQKGKCQCSGTELVSICAQTPWWWFTCRHEILYTLSKSMTFFILFTHITF
jgi:hypothetical protein